MEQRRTNNANLRQGIGRSQKLKERANSMKMAKEWCRRKREKKEEVLSGSQETKTKSPTYNWTREATRTSTTMQILDDLEHACYSSPQ